jgi:cell fate (sporulation/competence/biofilm development) regulator YlbF (YheA/YmcA/DUF963 family)
MNDNIERSLQQLIADILASEVYHKYDMQRHLVNAQPELKAQIDAYRARNLELQTSSATTLDQIDQFEREYAGFRENPLVESFLSAELAFCRMIQEINLRLTEAMHFE